MLDDVSCQLLSSKHLLDDNLVCRDDQQLTLYEMSPVQPILPVLVETTLITTPLAATIIKVQTSTDSNGTGVTCIPACQGGQFIHSQLIMSSANGDGHCHLTHQETPATVSGNATTATIQLQSTPHIVTIQVPDTSIHGHQSSHHQFNDSLSTATTINSNGSISSLQLQADQCNSPMRVTTEVDDKICLEDKSVDHCVQIETTEEITESIDHESFSLKTSSTSTTIGMTNSGSGNDDLLSCLMCGKHFVSIGRLKSHEKTHTKSRPFKCIDCGKTFTVRYSLICHTRVHTRERPYTCNMCGSRFSQASSLKTHQIYKHTKNFPYLCRHCGRGFISPGQKHEHILRHHSKCTNKSRKGKNFRKKKSKDITTEHSQSKVDSPNDSIQECEESSSFDLSSPLDAVDSLQDSLNI